MKVETFIKNMNPVVYKVLLEIKIYNNEILKFLTI